MRYRQYNIYFVFIIFYFIYLFLTKRKTNEWYMYWINWTCEKPRFGSEAGRSLLQMDVLAFGRLPNFSSLDRHVVDSGHASSVKLCVRIDRVLTWRCDLKHTRFVFLSRTRSRVIGIVAILHNIIILLSQSITTHTRAPILYNIVKRV